MSNTATLDAAGEAADAVSRLTDQHLRANGKASDIQDIVKFARFIWLTVRDAWESFQLRLEQGLEARQVHEAAASTALACDGLLRVTEQLEQALASKEEEVVGLSELLAAVPEVKAIQQAARDLMNLLNTSEPPIDEARLADGLAAIGRGEFENTAAILERLRVGAEL